MPHSTKAAPPEGPGFKQLTHKLSPTTPGFLCIWPAAATWLPGTLRLAHYSNLMSLPEEKSSVCLQSTQFKASGLLGEVSSLRDAKAINSCRDPCEQLTGLTTGGSKNNTSSLNSPRGASNLL